MGTLDEEHKAKAAQEEYYPYQLIKFCTKNKKGEADIDCVPSKWVTFNINTGKCECKYVPPPYDNDSYDLLHDFVKRQVVPPDSWPSHPITLQGHAKNYDEAINRLEILRQEDYAYTTDDNICKADKAAAITKTYRTKVIKGNAKVTRKLLRVPRIRTRSGDNRSANASHESNNFSNESSALESQDENDNDWTTEKSNWTEARRNVEENNNQQSSFEFPSDEDYMREVPQKSSKLSGKKITKKPGSSKKGRDSSVATVVSGSSKKASDSSVLPVASSNSKKGTNTSVSPVVSLSYEKETNAAVSSVASSSSKKKTDASVLPVSSSLIDTNSNEVRTHSPIESPTATKKEKKGAYLSAIHGLRYDIQVMTAEFKELKGTIQKSALAKDVFGANVQSFAAEYEVSLPMKAIEDFKAFDDRLQKEKKFRKEFTATLHYLIDSRTTLSKNITSILKKHLTRELALNFTAVKASGAKCIFKDTLFCKCVLEVSRMECKIIEKDTTIPITDKYYYRELGNALSNAIDWDGNRKQRLMRKPAQKNSAEKEKEKETAQEEEHVNEEENDDAD